MKLAILLGAVGAFALPASAQNPLPVDIEAQLSIAPKYVWRGINIVNDWVAQPEVTLSYGSFSFNVWGNFETSNWNLPNYIRAPRGRLTEVDMTLEYSRQSGPLEWGLGIVDYQFPGTGALRYQEWFASAGLPDQWGSPTLTLYTGKSSTTGTYATLGISRSLNTTLPSVGEVDLDAELSYGDAKSNDFYYGSRKAAFSDFNLTASKELSLGGKFTFKPAVHFSTLLDKSLLAGQPRRSNLWFSLNFGVKF